MQEHAFISWYPRSFVQLPLINFVYINIVRKTLPYTCRCSICGSRVCIAVMLFNNVFYSRFEVVGYFIAISNIYRICYGWQRHIKYTEISNIFTRSTNMAKAWCKTAVTPLLTQWSCCSLAPSDRYHSPVRCHMWLSRAHTSDRLLSLPITNTYTMCVRVDEWVCGWVCVLYASLVGKHEYTWCFAPVYISKPYSLSRRTWFVDLKKEYHQQMLNSDHYHVRIMIYDAKLAVETSYVGIFIT